MWLQANLHPKLLLLGEGRGAGRHFRQHWAPHLLTQTLSQTRTVLPRTQRSQIRDETRDGGLYCSVKGKITPGGSEPPSPLPPSLLTLTFSIPSLLRWEHWVVRATVYPLRIHPGKGPLDSHICITQTSDRKLGWQSLWAIVPALVGNPFVCKSTQWTITAPSNPVGVVSCSCCACTAALPTKGL